MSPYYYKKILLSSVTNDFHCAKSKGLFLIYIFYMKR